jgi:hypothetical protein
MAVYRRRRVDGVDGAIDDQSGRRPEFYCYFTSIAVIQ